MALSNNEQVFARMAERAKDKAQRVAKPSAIDLERASAARQSQYRPSSNETASAAAEVHPCGSRHEAEVVRVLATSAEWMNARELAAQADRVAPRTVRAITARLSDMGVVERVKLFDGHRYRLTMDALRAHSDYCDRLRLIAEATGIALRV